MVEILMELLRPPHDFSDYWLACVRAEGTTLRLSSLCAVADGDHLELREFMPIAGRTAGLVDQLVARAAPLWASAQAPDVRRHLCSAVYARSGIQCERIAIALVRRFGANVSQKLWASPSCAGESSDCGAALVAASRRRGFPDLYTEDKND